jgi:aspartate aminotransferase
MEVPETGSSPRGAQVAQKIETLLARSSWIRRMYEEGRVLKSRYGEDAIFDFSLGNPNVEPPPEFDRALRNVLFSRARGLHGYMPNAGYPEVREAVARHVSDEQGVEVPSGNIVMTCGAAGAANVIFKTILDPGDEVMVSRPYFGEYEFYVDNNQGILVPVATDEDFRLDLDAIERALTPKTRAFIVNSPNNPTGRVYSPDALASLGALLETHSRKSGRTVYLVSDEPYRRIVYDGAVVPPVLTAYRDTILVSSYSKELSIAGERIGFLAVSPAIAGAERLIKGLVLVNRILGFVNAPALMQRAIAELQGVCVDLSLYRRNRSLLVSELSGAGFTVPIPDGAFYLFPRSPVPDEDFVLELLDHRVIAVPGSGFGCPGYFRLAFCVAPEVVDGALPVFEELGRKYFH